MWQQQMHSHVPVSMMCSMVRDVAHAVDVVPESVAVDLAGVAVGLADVDAG